MDATNDSLYWNPAVYSIALFRNSILWLSLTWFYLNHFNVLQSVDFNAHPIKAHFYAQNAANAAEFQCPTAISTSNMSRWLGDSLNYTSNSFFLLITIYLWIQTVWNLIHLIWFGCLFCLKNQNNGRNLNILSNQWPMETFKCWNKASNLFSLINSLYVILKWIFPYLDWPREYSFSNEFHK